MHCYLLLTFNNCMPHIRKQKRPIIECMCNEFFYAVVYICIPLLLLMLWIVAHTCSLAVFCETPHHFLQGIQYYRSTELHNLKRMRIYLSQN